MIALTILCSRARAQSVAYTNFESHQTRPICLSPDGTRLFAVNTPDGRLSVFDVSDPANPAPVLIREIPVGVEPVSVNALSNDEAWVVNEVSDSVSIVSVSQGVVTDTLACKDEPADVVFAGGQAFISCSRNNLVRVFDLTTHAQVATIPLLGLNPCSLAVSNDGTKVYATFRLSGNRTTLLPADRAPAQPAPANSSLPNPPQVGLIVSASDGRLSPKPNMPDNDVAEINVSTRSVARYFKSTGTVNFFIAARPGADELWVANTEARNLVRFEPALQGHAVDNRITRVKISTGAVAPFDLNAGLDYAQLPNPAALSTALAQPTAIEFEADGAAFWIASFGTDRVAKVDANTGAVLSRIEIGPTSGSAADPRNKRGARGLAYQASTGRLFVLNRLSNSISVVSTLSENLLTEVPAGLHDPTPAVIRQGRGFLYDARLSGNGTQSCASCHIDGDRDELAWDLGDPSGSMETAVTLGGLVSFQMHPMKGPMTTQTLRGLAGMNPLHWRGDRSDFTKFNHAFTTLLGGAELSTADMNSFRDYINTLAFQPNPNQNLDRTMPAQFPPGDPNGGDPNAGRNTFINTDYRSSLRCNTCHTLPTGTNRVIIPADALDESQDFKVPHLRNIYQKQHFVRSATAVSLSGFGLAHDGIDPDMRTFLSRPVFGAFAQNTTSAQTIRRDLDAFMQCFDTGTAPAVGYTRTLRSATLASAAAEWTVLAAQASAGAIDLVARLSEANEQHGFVYRPATNDFLSDQSGLGAVTRAQLEESVSNGAVLTLMGVPRESGVRLGIDRDGDLVLDGDEIVSPEIRVEHPAGSNLVDDLAVVDFADVATDNDSTKTFTVKNIGNAVLGDIAVSIGGADAADFSLDTLPPSSLGPTGAAMFTVRFAPASAGPKQATLHIGSNDTDESSFDIELRGNATPPVGFLAFGASAFTVNETDGVIDIPVVRNGGSFGEVSVNFDTTNGTAVAPGDFGARKDLVVTLPDGAAEGTASVEVFNNPGAEANETFTVTLGAPTNRARMGLPAKATVLIIDSSALSPGTDTLAPALPAISDPKADALVPLASGDSMTITGTASDNKGVQAVEVSLNAGPFVPAVMGTPGVPQTPFSLTVMPLTGTNTVQVRSRDYAGRSSTTIRRFKILRPLPVYLAGTGSGSVTAGFGATSHREVGRSYTITATPAAPATPTAINPGSIFERWTVSNALYPSMTQAQLLAQIGVAASSLQKQTLTFIFREGLVLTAHFAANPFPALAGTYNGLVHANATEPPGGTEVDVATEGCFTATLDAKGGFSGKLTLDGLVLSVAGLFDKDGVARFGTSRTTSLTVARTGKPSLTMGLRVADTNGTSPGGQEMDGTATASDFKRSVIMAVSTLRAERAFFNGLTPGSAVPDPYLTVTGTAPFPTGRGDGAYTMALPPKQAHYAEIVSMDGATDLVTASEGNAFPEGSTILLEGNLPAPLVVRQPYYVVNRSGSTFQISEAAGGTAIDLMAAGTAVAVLDPDVRQVKGYGKEDYPQGHGVAIAKISKAGLLTLSGTLADGTPFTASSTLSSGNTVSLFARLYSSKGLFSARIKLKDLPLTDSDPDLLPAPNSSVLWLRPFMLSQYYPSGWPGGITVDLVGAKYDATGVVLRKTGNTPLGAADPLDGNAALIFSDGQLTEDLRKSASIAVSAGVNFVTRVPDAADPTFSLRITSPTGAISGSFRHTDDTVPVFQGIIIQKGPAAGGFGFFKTKAPAVTDYTGESGRVYLIGAP